MSKPLTLLILLILALPSQSLIPNADFDNDKIVNFDLSCALGNGYDLSFKPLDNVELGHRNYRSEFISWSQTDITYLKFFLTAKDNVTLAFYAGLLQGNGTVVSSSQNMTYSYAGYNFGPIVAFRIGDRFALRGSYILHTINSQTTTGASQDIPFYKSNPYGIEVAWFLTDWLEIDLGASNFGVVGFKLKV